MLMVNINFLPLPGEMVSFQANRVHQEGVKLYWQIINQSGVKAFVIEMSFDGCIFEQVEQKENTICDNKTQNYEILISEKQSAYYRIKVICHDDSIAYSKIRFVSEFSGQHSLLIYPNPDSGAIDLQTKYNITDNINLQMLNLKGLNVCSYTGNIEAITGFVNEEMQKLENGIYLLQMHTPEGIYTEKTVLKR